MSTTISIPGGTAVIKSMDEMTVRQRRLVQASFMTTGHIYSRLPKELLDEVAAAKGEEAVSAQKKVSLMVSSLALSQKDAESLLGLQDASIVAFLESWSLDKPIPTMDTVQDLDPELYDALAEATSGNASKLVLGAVNMEPTPPGVDSPFDESATSSSDSDSQTTKLKLMPKRQKDGASTTTDSSIKV